MILHHALLTLTLACASPPEASQDQAPTDTTEAGSEPPSELELEPTPSVVPAVESSPAPPRHATPPPPTPDLSPEALALVIDETTPPLGGLAVASLFCIGAGVLTATAPLFTIAERDVAQSYFVFQRFPHLPAAPLVGAGVGIAALGLTMLAIDLSVLDRRRENQALRLHINTSPTQAGLQLRGRF